jgi:hypothetical protein
MIAWTLLFAGLASAVETAEVRQLVYFHFLPGKSAEAIRIFRDDALPLYRATEPMLRFRAYREAESPEPLDLVVVSTFRGMAGMDASNAALSERARKRGSSVGQIYGSIGALAAGHRDEFFEVDDSLSWGDAEDAPLLALVSIRLVPERRDAYLRLLREEVVPWERKLGTVSGSASGRYLVSDGYDVLRVVGLWSLGGWHDYRDAESKQPFRRGVDDAIAETRTILVAPLPELSVR